MFVIRPIGKQALPNLKAGPAQAHDHRVASGVLRHPHGARRRSRAISRCGSTRRASASLSLHHFVNHGGPEFVVFRATPADVDRQACASARSNIRRFPAPASASGSGRARRVLRARLRSGSQRADHRCSRATSPATKRTSHVEHRVIRRSRSPSRASRSTMRFMQRVVPAIAQNTPGGGHRHQRSGRRDS